MTIRRAIETIKILAPHVSEMEGQSTAGGMLRALLSGLRAEYPVGTLRLLALMEDRHLDEVVHDYQEATGMDVAEALAEGFVTNPLVDLIEAGRTLGLMVEAPDA